MYLHHILIWRGAPIQKNRYGFDKLIIVGDIQNIRNIFKTRFGGNTDFNGYIDKFYSKSIYHFNNSYALSSCINKILEAVNFVHKEEGVKKAISSKIYNSGFDRILSVLIEMNLLRTRQVCRFYKRAYRIYDKEVGASPRSISLWRSDILLYIDFIYKCVGTYEDFLETLQLFINTPVSQNKPEVQFFASHLAALVHLLDNTIIHQGMNAENEHIFTDETNWYKYLVKYQNHYGSIRVDSYRVQMAGKDENIDDTRLFWLFSKALSCLKQRGFLD